MFNPRAEQVARSPNDTVNHVTFGDEQLGEIRTVLPRDAGDERAFRFRHGRSMIQGCGADKLEPRRPVLLHILTGRYRHLDALALAMQICRSFMNRESLLSQFEKLLPLAAKWAAGVEERIL